MRDRRQPRSNSNQPRDLPGPPAPGCGTVQPHVVRLFTPDEIDLDDLAEAIRELLGPDSTPQIGTTSQSDLHLLSFPHRGTHEVEAEEAP